MATVKKDTGYRDSLKLTEEKKDILRKITGSVSSKIDWNKVKEFWKYGDSNTR